MSALPVLPKGKRLTGTERTDLIRALTTRYVKGTSIRELAAQTGRSYGAVHRMLTESGTPLRGRGGAHTPRPATDE